MKKVVFLLLILFPFTSHAFKLDSNRYGITFLYSSVCPHCQYEGPILKIWSHDNKISVLPISLNGHFLPSWQGESIINNKPLATYGVHSGDNLPILILYDDKTKQNYTISHGDITIPEMENRINELINTHK